MLEALRTYPRSAAFGSVREVADAANVNIGTVTRTAQSLGFDGWSALQRELKARYLACLSVAEVADEHQGAQSTAAASLARDRGDLEWIAAAVPGHVLQAIAQRIATAPKTVVLAQGSYAAVGTALAHNSALAGYPVRHVGDSALTANALADFGAGDHLIAVNSWRIYESTAIALRAARKAGAFMTLITDTNNPLLEAPVDTCVIVPSESSGFFPSLVGALSIVQAIVVELAAIDPERSRRSLARAEEQWAAFGLLRPAAVHPSNGDTRA